ncbi:MAG: VWA domain-containing protein [Peptoniphilus sp.]|uniref:VWA domain-containing protein n=2 Tax=Peptoniphilus sp. TaxID=1971214 RepID=UPI0025D0CEB0|nr:VWA domain-containing protein [Peptoniphilus sp.]MCI5643433.1 VWA domain-containing protein [Peptoniphilus sp.]
MLKKNSRIQENRIKNVIWDGSMDYDSDPFITGEDISGNPDFYINLIIGLASKYFGSHNLERLFSNWEYNLYRNKFDMFAIFLLEDFIYQKEVSSRSVLKTLRKNYAKKFLEDKYDLQRKNLALKENLFFDMQLKRVNSILGRSYELSYKREKIFENLKLDSDTDKNNFEERILNIFIENLNYKKNEVLKFSPLNNITLFDNIGFVSLERSNKPTIFGDFKNKKTKNITSFLYSFALRRRKEKYKYIEDTFGKSIYSEDEMKIIEEKYLYGAHKKSKLHYTRGLSHKNIGEENFDDDVINRHLLKFKENKNFYNTQIKSLSKKIRMALSNHLGIEEVVTSSGKLISKLAYKSMISDNVNIFSKKILNLHSNIKVDLVLDASASLMDIESDIAIEAYIVSKSLENNEILNRVISYETVGDYTIITILKSYEEKSDYEKIFKYRAQGWNRDGLFYRGYLNLIDEENENHMMIVLTDALPRDIKPLINKSFFSSKKYSDKASLDDAKKELEKLKKIGIHTSAILNSDKVDNAKYLFDRNFIKIKSVKEIANVAGRFIQREIANIEKK